MRRLVLTAVLLLASASVSADTLRERIDRTFDVRPGAQFTLENTNGRITVNAWDEPRIRVRAEKTADSRDDDAARKAMRELQVVFDATPSRVAVRTNYPRGKNFDLLDVIFGSHVNLNVQYEISVPRSSSVEVDNTNGRIAIYDVSGDFDVETTNGRIELFRCSGAAKLATTNGAIRAEFVSVAPGKDLRFETTNGRIELRVPQAFAADLDASTTNGSVSTDLPVMTRSSDRNTLRGKMNGGGPTVRLRTTNGGIEIRTLGTTASASR
jgi:DUF4097 and DUF4098 domain-containing protein YvlB